MTIRTHLHRAARGSGVTALLVLAACAAGLLAPTLSSADEGRHERRGEDRQRERQHRPVRHRYPVYVPAPIYYPHYESPGISIVIPLDLR